MIFFLSMCCVDKSNTSFNDMEAGYIKEFLLMNVGLMKRMLP